MIKVFETTDMNKAAILATVEGIKIGLLTVEMVDGRHLVSYRNEYDEKMQPVVDDLIKKYDQKTLMIDANKLCFHLSFLRFLHNKKVKEFKSKN
ncbi:hypothetical protein AB7942_24035 [Neobacillus sp. BF23-41]|uniref:hypothetical protein n=1 Tax=Neobacillus sp. BF23-41 TaxID=3240280 RepID=UPI0034E3DE98